MVKIVWYVLRMSLHFWCKVAPSGRTYVVQSGDTLSEITARFGTDIDHLAELNGIVDPDAIYVGRTIYY